MKDSNQPQGSKLSLIPIELADQMIKAYDRQRRLPAARARSVELGKDVEEPSSIWVSKDALLELLDINKADGIRFYFAIADDYPGFKLKKQEQKKAHTVVLVATKSEDPDNPTMENSIDCLNIPGKGDTDHRTDGKIGTVLMPITSSNAGLPADDVGMCPPPVVKGSLLPL